MDKEIRNKYLFWIIFTEAVGALSGWLTRDGVNFFNAFMTKPPLSPPAVVFPVTWAILYLLMGIGAARIDIKRIPKSHSRALWLYLLQLAFNFLWSIVFFNVRAYLFAFLWLAVLWLIILAMILEFRKIDSRAAWMQVPYLFWVLFAGYLNLGVWVLNK